MTVFADASALVKLYADELGAEVVRRLPALAVANISRVEVPAALWRKRRLGEISATDAQLLAEDFEADFYGTPTEPPRFAVVALTVQLLDRAARLCAVHGLRGYDAVQLSGALIVHRTDPGCSEFAAFDRALRSAAATEGFTLVPADGALH
jgi:predicted nucleic acid-binding protein